VHGKRTKGSIPRPANLRFGLHLFRVVHEVASYALRQAVGLYLVRIVASLVGTTLLGCVVSLGVSISPLSAEQQKPAQSAAQKSAQPANTTAEPKSQAASAFAIPSDDTLVALISSTLIALDQADATGNYSVFRELGAPGFQVANSTGKLSETFAKLRSRSFDFSPIVLLQPKLIRRHRPLQFSLHIQLSIRSRHPALEQGVEFGGLRDIGGDRDTIRAEPLLSVADGLRAAPNHDDLGALLDEASQPVPQLFQPGPQLLRPQLFHAAW
jgi:hypothetical protein